MQNYSVLMTVFEHEKPEHFKAAVESMLNQTVKTNDFVIVCDGPLNSELDNIIYQFQDECKDLFNIVRLEENSGVGKASAAGVLNCKNELIAKMDSDDISKNTRCEREIEAFEKDAELAVVGSYIHEFFDDLDHLATVRKVPLTHEKICSYSKRRTSFNNPSIMFRKSVVLAVGNYSGLRRCEDFELFSRIIHAGYKTANLPECLLYYRVTDHTFNKRKNYYYFKLSRKMSHDLGHSSMLDVWLSCGAQFMLSKLPWKMRKWLYQNLIRRVF